MQIYLLFLVAVVVVVAIICRFTECDCSGLLSFDIEYRYRKNLLTLLFFNKRETKRIHNERRTMNR